MFTWLRTAKKLLSGDMILADRVFTIQDSALNYIVLRRGSYPTIYKRQEPAHKIETAKACQLSNVCI